MVIENMNRKGILYMKITLRSSFMTSIAIFLFVITLGGCGTQRGWTYSAEPPVVSQPLVNRTVSVSPFIDQRKKVNDHYALHIIPLMPFGWLDLDQPETSQSHCGSGLWMFRPNEDFAKASAEELNNSKIFKESFFTYKPGDGELLLRGTIKSTKYRCTIITYGLSIYGSLLWFIGFPAGTYENELELTLQLVDQKEQRVLWEKDYKKTTDGTSFIYKMGPDFNYDAFLKDILKDAMAGIKTAMLNPVLKP